MVASFWLFGAMLVGVLLVLPSVAPAGRAILKIGGLDQVSYYGTARSILFDGDWNLTNEFRRMSLPIDGDVTAFRPETGLPGSPYPIGFSLLEIPFLLLGNVVDALAGGAADGYSQTCIFFYFVGIIFYLCLGMTFLFALLRALGASLGAPDRRTDWMSWIIVLGLWPSTTLAYYTFSPMAHIVSFMASSLFLLLWWRAKDTSSVPGWISVGLAGGLLVLTRWEAASFLSIPPVYELLRLARARGSSELRIDGRWFRARLLSVACVVLVLVPQFLQWRAIYGEYVLDPHVEGFSQYPPRFVLHVLFSSKHGWFLWTPIALVGLVGLLSGLRRIPALIVPQLVALAAILSVLGSQPINWHQNWSFGCRTLTYCVPMIAFGLALLLFLRGRAVVSAVLAAGVVLSAYTLLFAVQYRWDLVPKLDRLTVQELIVDKVFFRTAWQRRAAFLAARQEVERGNPERAARVALEAAERLGADRNLLGVLVEAYRRSGDEARRAEAERKLEEVMDSRLW